MTNELVEVASLLATHEVLPLHLAVTLADDRLERLWAESNAPDPMLVILHRTKRALPVRLAIRAAELACEKQIRYDEDRRQQTMKPEEILDLLDRIDRGVVRVDSEKMRILRDALVSDEEEAEERDHYEEARAWGALRYAISAVIQAGLRLDVTLTVRLGVRLALAAGADVNTVAAWVRELGPPPTLAEIIIASQQALPSE